MKALEAAIATYLAERNRKPRPYTWTATVENILDPIGRAKSAFDGLANL